MGQQSNYPSRGERNCKWLGEELKGNGDIGGHCLEILQQKKIAK